MSKSCASNEKVSISVRNSVSQSVSKSVMSKARQGKACARHEQVMSKS